MRELDMLSWFKVDLQIGVLILFSIGFGITLSRGLEGQTQQLPEGPGKVATQRICGGCHAPEIVIGKRLTKEGWEQLVSSMIEKGATGTDDEFNQIIEYLAANFAKTKEGK